MRGLRRAVEVVLVSVGLAGSALIITATSAGAAQTNPAPLPLSPPGDSSNPTLENDRANFHQYLNEAVTESDALARWLVSNPASQCSQSVMAEGTGLIETLVSAIHPKIVTLRSELAGDGSLDPSLLREVGVELGAASTVLQRVRERVAPCMQAVKVAKQGTKKSSAPGSVLSIIEILRERVNTLSTGYANAYLNFSLGLQHEPTNPRFAELLRNLTPRYNRFLVVRGNFEKLEKEFAEHGEVDPAFLKEVSNGITTAKEGLRMTQEELTG